MPGNRERSPHRGKNPRSASIEEWEFVCKAWSGPGTVYSDLWVPYEYEIQLQLFAAHQETMAQNRVVENVVLEKMRDQGFHYTIDISDIDAFVQSNQVGITREVRLRRRHQPRLSGSQQPGRSLGPQPSGSQQPARSQGPPADDPVSDPRSWLHNRPWDYSPLLRRLLSYDDLAEGRLEMLREMVSGHHQVSVESFIHSLDEQFPNGERISLANLDVREFAELVWGFQAQVQRERQ